MSKSKIEWCDRTWISIPGYSNYYASDDGRILSTKSSRPLILSPINSKDGHQYVFLYRNGKSNKVWIHRAILMTFKRLPLEGEEGCHDDGDPSNNRLNNLRWDTKIANQHDRYRHGTICNGEKAGTHKLTEQDVISIRAEYGKYSLRKLAKKYGVSHTAIRRAAIGIKWSYLKEGLSNGTDKNRVG